MKSYKLKRCGSCDSKYFSNKNQFEIDMEEHKRKHNETKQKIIDIVIEEPDKIELRYRDAINALLYIREKYNIK